MERVILVASLFAFFKNMFFTLVVLIGWLGLFLLFFSWGWVGGGGGIFHVCLFVFHLFACSFICLVFFSVEEGKGFSSVIFQRNVQSPHPERREKMIHQVLKFYYWSKCRDGLCLCVCAWCVCVCVCVCMHMHAHVCACVLNCLQKRSCRCSAKR